jgi:hypothetical protein
MLICPLCRFAQKGMLAIVRPHTLSRTPSLEYADSTWLQEAEICRPFSLLKD